MRTRMRSGKVRRRARSAGLRRAAAGRDRARDATGPGRRRRRAVQSRRGNGDSRRGAYGSGEVGFSYVLGRDHDKARLAAVCDASGKASAAGTRSSARCWRRSGRASAARPPRREERRRPGSISSRSSAGRIEHAGARFRRSGLASQAVFRAVMEASRVPAGRGARRCARAAAAAQHDRRAWLHLARLRNAVLARSRCSPPRTKWRLAQVSRRRAARPSPSRRPFGLFATPPLPAFDARAGRSNIRTARRRWCSKSKARPCRGASICRVPALPEKQLCRAAVAGGFPGAAHANREMFPRGVDPSW